MLVAVIGAQGKMGRAMGEGIDSHPDHEVVARLDRGDDITPETLNGAEIAIEFTGPGSTLGNVLSLIDAGVHAVVGSTGWTEEDYETVRARLEDHPDVGALIAPNFALSAVLAMDFARRAAPFFESVEVVELHHPDKVDAPSGTAATTARMISEARGGRPSPDRTEGEDRARGADIGGVRVHAVRLRGLTAHEEILLGNPGEQLTIRTDSFDRSSFLPGILLGVRETPGRPGLTIGLESVLDLG